MKGAGLEAIVTAVRQLLAIVIAVLSIGGTGYLLSHKLSNPPHYGYWKYPPVPGVGRCVPLPPTPLHEGSMTNCEMPTRAAWQVPLAVLLAIVGLGAAGAVRGETRRAELPNARVPARPPA
jgi:hypothetical protein